MTKEDIIRMAREAGIYHAHDSEGQWDGLTDVQLIERHPSHPSSIVYGEKRIVEILERFTQLVAAATVEALAKHFDDRDKGLGLGFYDPHEPAEIIREWGKQ